MDEKKERHYHLDMRREDEVLLIASDIDGTLLTGQEERLEDGIGEVIERLYRKGIMFVPASGRQLRTLRKLFQGTEHLLHFITDNGSLIYGKGDHPLLSYTEMDRDLAIELAYDILSHGDVEVLISGNDMSYLIPKGKEIVHLISDVVGNNVTIINRPEDVAEPIVKVSGFDLRGASVLEGEMKAGWEDHFSVAIAGLYWLDFNLADKGTGISELAKMLSIPLSSVMAFGDNYNDMPMLMKVGHPYLMSTSSVRDVPPNFKRTDSVVSVLKRFEESLCDV